MSDDKEKEQPTTNGNTFQSAFWSGEFCNLCRVTCPTDAEKALHSDNSAHMKRRNIHDFLKKCSSLKVSCAESAIARRYSYCQEKVIGVECVFELSFSWCKTGWWACSLCYESGSNFDQLDEHLHGRRHLTTYIDELHPEWKIGQADVDTMISSKDTIFDEEQEGKVLPPEVLQLELSKEQAWVNLVLIEKTPPYKIIADNAQELDHMFCEVCYEVIPCRRESSAGGPARTYAVHSLTSSHRAALTIKAAVDMCNPVEEVDESAGDDVDLEWKKSEKGDLVQPLQGPVCGIHHLVVFGRKCLCTLCFCLVGSLEEHFSSESHILKYVSTLKPGKGYFYTNCSRETRRVELLNQLNKKNLGNELSRQCDLADIPKVIKELAYEGTLPPPDFMPTPHPLNLKQKAMFCEACWRVLSMDSSDNLPLVWETHIASIEHLTLSAKRGEYFFDDHYFVCMASKVTLPPKQLKGLWKNVGTEEEPKYLQDQSDVALEYVVQDVLNDELVCTLCAEVYEHGNEKELGTHIRSLDHLTQYLQVCNRELYSALVCHENTPVILEMTMDWLQRAVTTACDDIKVYHPVLATKMESWQRVPMKMIESSHLDPEHRTVYECVQSLLDATDDNDDRQAVDCSLREALVFSSMLIVQIQEKVRGHVDILFKCTACELVFSTSDDRVVEDIWEKHMRNEEHFRRWKVFSDNRMDAFDFAPTSSSHKVSSFVQTDPKKVIAWQYNAADKTYDFVLRIVGQEELVERRSLPNKADHVPDFFCSLCAISFPRRSYVLESHIRSHTHVYNYAQKHFPMEIPRLEQLPKDDGGKRLRKELALLLRDVKPPSEYCIAVYDPCGEQERRGIVALQKAKEADRERQMDEMRKAAAEKRKEQDEERRKRREIELEREKRDQERRAREEREARARYEEQRETKEKLKQLVLAKKKELEEEKRKVDKEKERIKEKEKARMKEQLEREKQRLRELKEKKQKAAIEAEQARLKKELEELQRRKEEDRIRKTVPAPSLIIPNIGFKIATKSLEGNAAPLFASTSNNVFSTTPVAASIASLTTSSAFGNSTIGPCPPPNMSGIGMHIGMQTSAAPQMVPSSVWNIVPAIRPSLMNACVDPCILDPIIIRTREQLVDYMWRRGTVPIPAEEMPEKFSNLVLGTEGLLGLETVYEVCCIDDPKLDSFYCVLCNHWTMPKPMLDHLKEPAHIQAFLQKHYMVYYQAVQTESDESMRSALLQQFAIAIWQKDRPQKPVYLRLSQVLNRRVLDRLWPDHYRFIDHAWLDQPFGGAAMQSAGVDVSDDDLEGTPMDDGNHEKKKRKRRGGSRQKAKEKEREKEKREREKKEKKELERKEKERKEREEREEREEEKERERKEKEKKEKERRAREREELERVRREKEEKQRQLDILKEVERRKHEEAIKRQQQQQEEERRLAEERQRVEQEELERRRAHELEMRRQHELRMQMQQSEQERIELQKAELLRQREELQRLQAEVERKRIEELEKIAVRQREAELQMKLDMEAHAALLREAEKEAARREEKERKRKQKKEEEAKAAKEREKAEKAAAKEREKREKERKEREAKEARSRKRSRSRSRDKSKRSTSVERKRKSRSRSRERKDREKSARSTRSSERKKAERTELAVPSSSSLGKNLSWEESAAAFLAKIGGTQPVQSPSKEPSRKRRTSQRRSPSPAKRRTKEDATKTAVDVASEQQRVRSDSVSTTSSQPTAGSASAKVAPQQALDPNQKLRKMLGLIIMMQKEAEQRGGLEESVVDELYNEMGLSRGDVSESNDMMGQLCSLLGGGGSQKRDANIDLSKFGISKESSIESTTPTVTPAHAASMPSSHVPTGQSGAMPSASTVDFYRSVASNQGNVTKTTQVAAPPPVSAPMAMAPQHQQPSTSRPPVQSHPYVSEYQSTPTYSDSPAYNSPAQSTSTMKAPAPTPSSGSGGLNLPPHLMSMLSGLKGSLQTLEQIKKQQEPAPTQYQGYSHKPMEEPSSLFSSHLVINRPEDVFGDSDEISYVYPARDDLETGESAARRQTIVRDYAKDYEDYQNIQQYHQEKEQQHQQMLQKQRQQQLHHQLQLQKQQEQEEQMMQNQPPQKKKAKQGRLPKELMNGNPAKDPRMQLVDWSKTWWPGSTLPPPWCVVMNYMHLLPFSYEEYGKAKLYLCEGRLSAKKTGKMRQQLADMGFNRDAFTYTVVGPIPIPMGIMGDSANIVAYSGYVLCNLMNSTSLLNDYIEAERELIEAKQRGMSLHGGSEEPLHQRPHSGASQNDGNGVRNPESGAKRGQPSVGTSHNPVVLDDEDWEGVEDNLEKILQEEQRKLQEQQQYSKYNFLHLSAKAGVDVMAPKPSGPNSGHGWPKTPYKPEPMRRGTADVPVRKEASVADAEQESWRQPVLPPKGASNVFVGMLGGTSSTPVDPRIGAPPPTTVSMSSAPSVLSTTQSSAVSGQGPKTVTSSVAAPAAKPAASKPTPGTPAAAAKKPAPPAKQAVVNRKALPSLLATEAPPPPPPTTEPVDPYAYHPPQVTPAAHAQPQYYGPTDPNYQPANVYGAGMYDAAMGQPQVGYTAMPMQPQQAYGAYPQQPDPYQQQQDPYQQQQAYAYDPAYAQYYGQGGYYQ